MLALVAIALLVALLGTRSSLSQSRQNAAALRRQVAAQSHQIADLHGQVGNLNTTLAQTKKRAATCRAAVLASRPFLHVVDREVNAWNHDSLAAFLHLYSTDARSYNTAHHKVVRANAACASPPPPSNV